MYLLGYSLNNLTLMALTISTGFVVDDAIVMIENIMRYVEEGERAAASRAERRRANRLHHHLAHGFTHRCAHSLLFMGDITGRLFREFAVTLAVTIIISAVVSLTLTPMLCAKLLRHKEKGTEGRLYKWSERVFENIIAFYGRTLELVLRFRVITLLVAAATLALTVLSVHDDSERLLPGARYRRNSGRFRSRSRCFISLK